MLPLGMSIVLVSFTFVAQCLDAYEATSLAMRVEWAKLWARSLRWTEEVNLTCEEMRRVIIYCDWKSRWWLIQRYRRRDVSPELAAGLAAYGEKQSNIYKGFAKTFGKQWSVLLRRNSIPVPWPSEFTDDAGL